MPELPEVETVCRGITKKVLNKHIKKVVTRREGLRVPFPKDLAQKCNNATVKSVIRRAKFVLIHLDNDQTIIIHLGMSGKVTFPETGTPPAKHDHLSIYFEDDIQLCLNDTRRFGVVDISATKDLATNKHLEKLGVEPLTDQFDGDYLYKILQNKRIPIKQAIMDGHLVVGVGNIYASESLFKAAINPTQSANTVTKSKIKLLCTVIKQTLTDAIAAGGSTLQDYVQTDGSLGYFQHQFKVYGRDKQPCQVCETPIEKIVQGGRATFFCPKCQIVK